MNITALAAMLQEKYLLSRRHSRQVIDDIFDSILEEASKGNTVTLRGIGTFRLLDPEPKQIPRHAGSKRTKEVDPPPTIRFDLSPTRRAKLKKEKRWWFF